MLAGMPEHAMSFGPARSLPRMSGKAQPASTPTAPCGDDPGGPFRLLRLSGIPAKPFDWITA